MEVVARPARAVVRRLADEPPLGALDASLLPAVVAVVPGLRGRPRLRLGPRVPGPLRHLRHADLRAHQRGRARHRLRGPALPAGADTPGAAGAVRRGRRRRGHYPVEGTQGMGAGLSRRDHAEGRLRVGAAPEGGPDARAPRRRDMDPPRPRTRPHSQSPSAHLPPSWRRAPAAT